jgi:hypothetical protein
MPSPGRGTATPAAIIPAAVPATVPAASPARIATDDDRGAVAAAVIAIIRVIIR